MLIPGEEAMGRSTFGMGCVERPPRPDRCRHNDLMIRHLSTRLQNTIFCPYRSPSIPAILEHHTHCKHGQDSSSKAKSIYSHHAFDT